jgi:hypothetical protein
LAHSPALHNLKELNLEWNEITTQGAFNLSESSTLGQLSILKIWGNNIGESGAKALSKSENLKNLTNTIERYEEKGPPETMEGGPQPF